MSSPGNILRRAGALALHGRTTPVLPTDHSFAAGGAALFPATTAPGYASHAPRGPFGPQGDLKHGQGPSPGPIAARQGLFDPQSVVKQGQGQSAGSIAVRQGPFDPQSAVKQAQSPSPGPTAAPQGAFDQQSAVKQGLDPLSGLTAARQPAPSQAFGQTALNSPPAQAPSGPDAAPLQRVAVPQPIGGHGLYRELMRSHDRVHTRHLEGHR